MSRNPTSSSSAASSELLCKVKYLNNLPDIPFDPKFIAYPFGPNRFINYSSTSLEKNFKWEILNEQDLGVRIDLINPDTYKSDSYATLHEADEKLLEEETLTAADAKRSEQHNKSVAWMRRNEYISTENTRFQPKQYDNAEAKVGYGSLKRKLSQLEFYKDRESQIKAIEKSFEAVKQPIEKHFSKPNVFPVQEMPIFPDFDLWKYSCTQVIFDDDPLPKGKHDEAPQALIRGMIDESGEQFVAYFLPTEETQAKRKRDEDNDVDYDSDDDYQYKLIREYTWSVKSKTNSGYEENYYFIIKDSGVYYNTLETRVRLNKRRNKTGKPTNTRLVVKYRDLNGAELKQQRMRLNGVKHVTEDEQEEEEHEDNDESKNVSTAHEDDEEKEENDEDETENEHGNEDDKENESSSEENSDDE